MKFTLVKDLNRDPLMRPLLGALLLFTFAFIIADLFNTASLIGLTYDDACVALYGDEENFMEPMMPVVLMETLHAAIFFTMMLLLTLSAIFARLCTHERLRLILINGVMLSAILSLAALPAALYAGELFIWVWLVMFWGWHMFALLMTLLSGWNLVRS